MNRRLRTAAAFAVLALLTACSTDPGNSSGTKTGAGVTDDTITLGILTDLSGPFAAANRVQVPAFKAFWDARNEAGGICGREIKLDVQDHGYDPQRAVSLYRSMEPNVLAIQQLLGSPMVPAVMPLAEADGLYVGGVGLTSTALPYRSAQLPGTTYAMEGANAVDFLVDDLKVPEGSKIGAIYFGGDLGEDALAGVEHAAEERGLEVVRQEITPQVTDLSAQASALAQADVSAVFLAAAPTQLASLASVLQTNELDIPVVTASVTFNPSVLDTPAAEPLLKNGYTVLSFAPYSAEGEAMDEVRDLYESALPDGLRGWDITITAAEVAVLAAALEKACEADDLTPAGVVNALRSLDDLDLGSIYPTTLDYGTPGEPPLRQVYVSKMDDQIDGGLKVLNTLEGPSAGSYKFD